MVQRLLQLNLTQIIGWQKIGSTLAWVRLAKSDNATLARRFSKCRSKLALNSIHKSCKLQNNLFKRCSPLTSMRCTKEISRPGMANYKKSLLT